jgi:hypothetical protein
MTMKLFVTKVKRGANGQPVFEGKIEAVDKIDGFTIVEILTHAQATTYLLEFSDQELTAMVAARIGYSAADNFQAINVLRGQVGKILDNYNQSTKDFTQVGIAQGKALRQLAERATRTDQLIDQLTDSLASKIEKIVVLESKVSTLMAHKGFAEGKVSTLETKFDELLGIVDELAIETLAGLAGDK